MRKSDQLNSTHVKMEQESFQSKHVSGLESIATTPQSASLSYDQVYNGAWQEKSEQCMAGYTEETCTGEVETGG